MSDLKLFRVTVTHEWRCSGEALVLATSGPEAKRAALAEVELDWIDGVTTGRHAAVSRQPVETLQALDPRRASELWLIAPAADRPDEHTTVELAEFQAVLSSDQLEAIRLRQIEADNGQLALLGGADEDLHADDAMPGTGGGA